MKGKSYQPFGGGPSKTLISRAAKQSASRAESYSFKTKNGAERDVGFRISMEMISLAEERSHLYDPSASIGKWNDKGSQIAAPMLASDMYLQCDRGSSSLILQGPRFFHEELSVATEDDPATGMPRPPDVSRFPYSNEAHAASKKLSAKLAKNLARRHYAAAVLQRSYRTMRSLQRFRAEVQEAHMACRKIQWFWRKRLTRTRARRAEFIIRCRAAVRIQCIGRHVLARNRVSTARRRKFKFAAIIITRFMHYVKKEVKRRRGRNVRIRVHATRIQARFRSLLGRRRLLRMIWAKRRIYAYYRAHWERKKGIFARRIFHYLRRSYVHRKIHKIQAIVRGFLGRRSFHRYRLGQLAFERNRATLENELIRYELERDVREKCYSWITQPAGRYGNELQRDISLDFMRNLDVCANSFLRRSYDKDQKPLERRMTQFPYVPLEDILTEGGQKRAISLAVLSCFCNHPHGMIDWAALELCKQYLTPVRGWMFGRSERSEDEIWESLQKDPLVDIISASALLEPILSLRCRVTVQGHLPDSLLGQAVVLRRWTHHVDFLVKRAIWKARLENPPKRQCSHCLQAFSTTLEMRQHSPCNRFGWASWVSRQFFQIQFASLKNRLRRILAFPVVLRDAVEDLQNARIKISARRELAKKRGGYFVNITERNNKSIEDLSVFSDLDITRSVDKKALRIKNGGNASPSKSLVGNNSPSSNKALARSPGLSPAVHSPASTPAQSAKHISPKGSPGSPNNSGKSTSSIVLPPSGVEFIPFFEEHFPLGQEQLKEFSPEEWLDRPGVQVGPVKDARDKEGKLLNFEFKTKKKKNDKAAAKAVKK